jgi:maltose O-acetyltransferase
MTTERERMMAGELYLSSDPELVALRTRARLLTGQLNQLAADAPTTTREAIYRQLFAQVGEGCHIEPPFRCDYGSGIELGRQVYLNFNCVILDCSPVRIGDQVKFGPGVQLYAAFHPIDPQTRRTDPRELGAPILIEANVWIGGGTIVLPGVRIGENSVIGAGSVVTRDIPANVVAVGNPCRPLRSLLQPPPTAER